LRRPHTEGSTIDIIKQTAGTMFNVEHLGCGCDVAALHKDVALYVARFRQEVALEDAIAVRAFATLEALPCVWTMSFLSGVHASYRLTL
jgi:hypothetical protein